MGEFCVLLVDRLAEQGNPVPTSKTPDDISHFKAVLADEWRKGNV